MRKKFTVIGVVILCISIILCVIYGNIKNKHESIVPLQSINVLDINDSVILGSKYSLPQSVKGTLPNGTEKEVSVVWNPSKVDTSKSGTCNFTGKIKGYSGTAKLALKVEKIISVTNFKASINQGEELKLPVTAEATIEDGTKKEVTVNWGNDRFDSSKTGIYNIQGSVDGYDNKINVNVFVSSKSNGEKKISLEEKKIKRIPVLMYHYVEDYTDKDEYKELKVSKEKFKQQLQYLKDNGYTTLTLNDIYDFIVNHKCMPEKSVALTFDDGYNDNYTNAFPLIKEYGDKGTVFVVTDWVDKADLPYISSEHLKEMDANGMDIESHTVNHDHLPTLTYDKQLQTLKDSKAYLENLLNKKVNYIAYPFGEENENTLKAVKASGYNMAFLSDGKWSDENQGIYTLARVYISSFFDIKEFENRITNPDYN